MGDCVACLPLQQPVVERLPVAAAENVAQCEGKVEDGNVNGRNDIRSSNNESSGKEGDVTKVVEGKQQQNKQIVKNVVKKKIVERLPVAATDNVMQCDGSSNNSSSIVNDSSSSKAEDNSKEVVVTKVAEVGKQIVKKIVKKKIVKKFVRRKVVKTKDGNAPKKEEEMDPNGVDKVAKVESAPVIKAPSEEIEEGEIGSLEWPEISESGIGKLQQQEVEKVEKSELGSWKEDNEKSKSKRGEAEKGEFGASRLEDNETENEDFISDGWEWDRWEFRKDNYRYDYTIPYGSDDFYHRRDFNRWGSQNSKSYSSRWESEQDRTGRFDSKFLEDDNYYGKNAYDNGKSFRNEYSSGNRLKRHNTDSDGSDWKHYGDFGDYNGSKSRRLSEESNQSTHSGHYSSDRFYRNSSSSDKYTSRYHESSLTSSRDRSRYYDNRDWSPGCHERSPNERERSPYILEKSPYDRSGHFDHRNRSSVSAERSPQDRLRNHRDRTPSYSERSSLDRGRSKEMSKKNGTSGKRISDLIDKDSKLSSKKFQQRSNVGLPEKNGNSESHKEGQPQSIVKYEESSHTDGPTTEEPPSMEEDMDICDTPPHVPILIPSVPKWSYLDHLGLECGPLKLCEIRTLVDAGALCTDHFIKHLDTNRWVTVENAVSPLLTRNFHSIMPDTITQFVSPPEATGNLLYDSGDYLPSVIQFAKETQTIFPQQICSSEGSQEASDLHIDKRVEDLLEGYVIIPGKELETISEALQMEFGLPPWEEWENSKGFIWHQVHGEGQDEDNSEVRFDTRSDKNYGFVCNNESGNGFSDLWPCKGGDWKRSDEAAQGGTCRKKVLTDNFLLCSMPKSGCEDPRWHHEDLYYPSHCKELKLPHWAFSSSDDLTQPKSVVVKGVKGTMLPVVRINSCVVKDHYSSVSEPKSKPIGYPSRPARSYNNDIKRSSAERDYQPKVIHELKSIELINTPKNRLCSVSDLKLHSGQWYYRDGSGREQGPFSFAQLQVLVNQGFIQKGSSVLRKSDQLWVPVTSTAETSSEAAGKIEQQRDSPTEAFSESRSSSSFHSQHPQFIGFTRAKLYELVMKSFKSREFPVAISQVLDPWIEEKQPKKEMDKHAFRKLEGDPRSGKRARLLVDECGDEYETEYKDELTFEDLCGNSIFDRENQSASSETEAGSWGLLGGRMLARVFHFLRSDLKSLSFASSTCKHWRDTVKIYKDSHSKIKSSKITDKKSLISKSKVMENDTDDFDGLKDYFNSGNRGDYANQAFSKSLYKRSKLYDARKSSSILSRDARTRRWAIKKSENGYKRMEEFLASSLKDIMKENTFEFFVPKVAEIEENMKSGYYIRHGLNSVKQDISRMCRDAIKAKKRGIAEDMNHVVSLFINLAALLEEGSKASSYGRHDMFKKKLGKIPEMKSVTRSNGPLYATGGLDYGERVSDSEIRKRLSKLKNRSLNSGSETSDELDRSSEGWKRDSYETDNSDTESDSDFSRSQSVDSRRDAYFDSMTEEREWGARMTKASLVPPVTRTYEFIDQYVVVADEEEVERKMRVALPEDYSEKLNAQKNGTGDEDMALPEVKDYKSRKLLGVEVIEQEVYGIDPYTHNLLLDSMPEELNWSLAEKQLFIEEKLLCSLNKHVRHLTGSGNLPMKYCLQPVVEQLEQEANDKCDIQTIKMCQGILKAIDSRPDDNYVAYRKGLGVVCNKKGGFGGDDFVVEFVGEVYPVWKWFEKQDGIRYLQKGSNDPAPEFYNINLERPKGDADGYDLVVIDAMHKANYASRICHSCSPNCEAKVTAVNGQYQIGIYTVREIQCGEEITFDYNSVTESKEEYEASVCLCGSQVCRGSYLNLTGEGAFQTVLEDAHGILDRHQLLLEACETNLASHEDYHDLGEAGLGRCLLGGLPEWVVAYCARLVRFINFERKKLPKEILKYNLEEKRKYFSEICLAVEKSDAEVQAEGVYNQRLHNLAITLHKVRHVMKCVFGDPKNAPPPLEKLSPEEAVSNIWKGEGSLVEQLLQCISPHVKEDALNKLKSNILAHDPSGSHDLERELQKSLLWLREEIRNLPCTYKCRHDAAADLIHMYAYTKCFFRVREYQSVVSPPLYITPLDLGPKSAQKLGAGPHEYSKTYGENYCLGQLIYWYNQTNADPDCSLDLESRGCLLLPDIRSFYAHKPSPQRVYGPNTVKFMLARMEKQPQRPWPKDQIWSFEGSSPKIFGSPMFDAVLQNSRIDKEMKLDTAASNNSIEIIKEKKRNFEMADIVQNGAVCLLSYLHKAVVSLVLGNIGADDRTKIMRSSSWLMTGFIEGREIHGEVVKVGFLSDVFVFNGLIALYVKFEELGLVRAMFDEFAGKDLVSWNLMLGGYVRRGEMIKAQKLFDEMPDRDVASWSIMIDGHGKIEHMFLGLFLLTCLVGTRIVRAKMEHMFLAVFVDMSSGILQRMGNVVRARFLFDSMPCKDLVSWNSILDIHTKAGELGAARQLFDSMPWRNVISWSIMIDSYASQGNPMAALDLFSQMICQGIKSDQISFMGAISACAQLGALDQGKWIHTLMNKKEMMLDTVTKTALIDMYMKCGSIEEACRIFNNMSERSIVSWNVMILGLSMNGFAKKALDYFSMVKNENLLLDDLIFLSALAASSHAGLVDEGLGIVNEMKNYGVEPKVEHYSCLIDLLGRAGHLDQALGFLESMPMNPNSALWGSLLLACRIHKNVSLAEIVPEGFSFFSIMYVFIPWRNLISSSVVQIGFPLDPLAAADFCFEPAVGFWLLTVPWSIWLDVDLGLILSTKPASETESEEGRIGYFVL
ncbi:hypothetical protein ACFE04_030227 [Oxalis oulophora]